MWGRIGSQMKKSKRKIPRGLYCYKFTKKIKFDKDAPVYGTIYCPYYEHMSNGVTRCNFLDIISYEFDPYCLIWDGCKECGIKDNLTIRDLGFWQWLRIKFMR